jgi:tRNA-splicing ligase RtcB
LLPAQLRGQECPRSQRAAHRKGFSLIEIDVYYGKGGGETEDVCNQAMKGIAFDRWGKSKKSKWGKKRTGTRASVDLSEAPQAFKDIESVIEAERDLVEPVVRLRPLAVVKG